MRLGFLQSVFLVATFATSAFADTNFVQNSGFDSATSPWNWSHTFTTQTDSAEWIQGGKSLSIDFGSGTETSGISQLISGFSVGDEFIYSANFKVLSGTGTIELLVRYTISGGTTQDDVYEFDLDNSLESSCKTCWNRIQLKTTVPTGATAMRVFCRFEDTTGKVFVDYVRLIKCENLLDNPDFEDATNTAWTGVSGDASIVSTSSYFGSKSLKIDVSSTGLKNVYQWVEDISDEPVYTLKAHVLTDGVSGDGTGKGGARFLIRCYPLTGGPLRILRTPYFVGDSDAFVERSISFLVPKGTVDIRIELEIRDGAGIVYFDNVQLTSKSVPASQFVDEVGHTYGIVQAPEPDTFVPVGEYTTIQAGVDATSDGGTDSGKVLWFPKGTHITDKIELGRCAFLLMHRGAKIQRSINGPGGGGSSSAFFKSPSDSTPLNDVTIDGGHFVSDDKSGRVFDWRGDRWIIRNMYIPTWTTVTQNARAFSWYGDDAYIYQNTVQGPGNTNGDGKRSYGGIIMAGGSRAHIMNNDVHSGDDAIGLFTTTRPTKGNGDPIPSFDRDIFDVEVYNNVLNSTGGRSFACGHAVPRVDTIRLTADVMNIRVRNATGICGGTTQLITVTSVPATAAYTGSGSSDLPICSDIEFYRMDIEGDLNDPEIDGSTSLYKRIGIYLFTDDIGSLENISFDDVHVDEMEFAAFEVRQNADATELVPNDNICLTNCTLDGRKSVSTNGSTQATYIFLIDGEKGVEVCDIELIANNNSFLGTGLKEWTDE